MNCKQARALFSSRVDNEIPAGETADLDRHLRTCENCAAHWASFETTVRMVRTLPTVAPDPAFVGQVLDRVRAYEDQDRHEASVLARPDFGERVRGFVESFRLGHLAQPAQWTGAMAFGVLVGFALVWAGVMPGGNGLLRHPSLMAQGGGGGQSDSAPGSSSLRSSDRPFGDLADRLLVDPIAPDSSDQRLSDPDHFLPGMGPGVFPGGSQQVGLSGAGGRPRITF